MATGNKVWFVTGASSGFGRALVEEVVARGERVVATARDSRALDEVVARAPDRVLSARLDVTPPRRSAKPSPPPSRASARSTSS
jgi:NAD(P)-dependent dehydrogenase (short-subunit alcohol dehydrogenase family)